MTLEEIKQAVNSGLTVCWKNDRYEVVKCGGYWIDDIINDSCVGLTWQDGVTLNGEESDFYIKVLNKA